MLRIVQFLACLAVLNQVNCFFNPLASLLLDSPAMLPFDEVLEETKMLAAVKQMGGGDLEDVLLAPFGQIQVPEQQQQQQQQQQLQLQQQQQQQLTRKQQRQQQQQLEQQRQQELEQQRQQELEREQEQRKRQQQEQEQRTQQQQQQQREQQQKQQQREQRRQQKEQQLKQDQQKTEQQQQQQKLQQQQQPKQIKQLDQLQIQVLDQDGQERLEGRVSQNEEILHDFADLKQRMDYIRDKIVRTIQVAKSQIEDHQRQADKQIQTLVLEQQRLQQQIRLLEQQREQQQQLQQLQLPEQQQQDELMMLRARSPLSRLSDELIMPRRMFQTDRMLDAMMPVPIVAMKIDTIDQISPLSLLNQISNSIMQNPLLPLSKQSEAQSCDQVHGKAMDAHRENRIRIQHTLIKQTTYRFESSTCQCQQQQQQQQQLQQQQQQTLEHCSLAYSRPDQQTCKVVELNNRQQQAFASNCEALEACRAQGAQCDGVYHDGAKYYLIECKQQGQRIATRPGLGAEYIIQLRSCF